MHQKTNETMVFRPQHQFFLPTNPWRLDLGRTSVGRRCNYEAVRLHTTQQWVFARRPTWKAVVIASSKNSQYSGEFFCLANFWMKLFFLNTARKRKTPRKMNGWFTQKSAKLNMKIKWTKPRLFGVPAINYPGCKGCVGSGVFRHSTLPTQKNTWYLRFDVSTLTSCNDTNQPILPTGQGFLACLVVRNYKSWFVFPRGVL